MDSPNQRIEYKNRNSQPFSQLPILEFTDNDNSENSDSSSYEDNKKNLKKRPSLRKSKSKTILHKKVSFLSNENEPPIIKKKSKFYHSNNNCNCLNTKKKSLEIFEENYDLLKETIIKEHKRKLRSKSTILLNKHNLNNNEEKIISLTNMEMISDFYEYTENCMKLITEIEPKEKLKNKITPRNFEFEGISQRKKIAVFDLDETLIHCIGDIRTKKKEEYQNVINVLMPNNINVKIGINIRPNWKESLIEIKKKYYIIVYTASHNNYADAVLNFLDPENNVFEGRLYRKDCILYKIKENKFYIKDLNIFQNFNLKDIVLIDNSVLSFAYHLNNGIPIVPYYNSKEDSELIILSKYLLYIADCDDLRECNKEYINMESFLEQAKIEKIEESFYSESDDDNENLNNKNVIENEKNENIKNDKNNVDKNDFKNEELIIFNNNDYYSNEKIIKKIYVDNKKINVFEIINNNIKNKDNIIFFRKNNYKKTKTERNFLKRREEKQSKMKTQIIKNRISIYEENFNLEFSKDENKIQIPKTFKRRSKTIKNKIQTMMNQMHFTFINKEN